MYPNRITPFFNDYKTMKCPFILILTGLNVGPLAATTFQIATIYSFTTYAQCWESDPISGLKTAKSPIHFTWWILAVFSLETGPIPNILHI